MVTQDLIDYINKSRSAGASETEIRASLVKNGWVESDIISAMGPNPEIQQAALGGFRDGPTIESDVHYAGFWIRAAAALIDGLVMAVPLILLNIFAEIPFAGLILAYLYLVLMTKEYQATLGKMAVGIKVVSSQSDSLNWGQVILREVVGKFLSGLILDIGYIMVAFTQRKQGLHDIIAKTYVVYKNPEKNTKTPVIAIVAVIILIIFILGGILAGIILKSLNSAKSKAKQAQFRATISSVASDAIICADQSSLNSQNAGIGKNVCSDTTVSAAKYPSLPSGICANNTYSLIVQDLVKGDGKFQYSATCKVGNNSVTINCSEMGCR